MNSTYAVSTPAYPELTRMLGTGPSDWRSRLTERIIPYLAQAWLRHYDLAASRGEVVEVHVDKHWYLFDIGPDRLIAAWGISEGRFSGDRDKRRMQQFPLPARPLYHAGHAIPHRLGGGTDINLTAQLGSLNTGPFRELENRAVKTDGSLYFTYWMYGLDNQAQRASRIQQGLLVCGHPPEIRIFNN